jgi:hypothetical protein
LRIARPAARRASGAPLWITAAVLLARPCRGQAASRPDFEGTLFRGVSLLGAPSESAPTPRLERRDLLAAAMPQAAPPGVPVASPPPKRFALAASELALLEVLPWAYNRYIADEDFARISWHTVSENFKAGFGFDSDHFNVNQSQHPYHGSLFFEAARSNGYNYWESGAFALAGSFLWECCMENTQPAWNDLVNTTLGGMTRGEVSHRLAAVILDNTAGGSERFWRELAAAVINPVGALTRLVDGDMARDSPNPEERFPDGFDVSVDAGYRRVQAETGERSQALLSFSARYGDPFAGDIRKPFDSFWAGLDLTFPNGPAISRLEERGVLKGWELTERTDSARHILGVSQEYEYINNASQVFGAQMFGAAMLSRYAIRDSVFAVTDLGIVATPLAGIQTTNFASPQTGRNYDYGVGGGVRAAARLFAGGQEVLSVGYGAVWEHTVNGVSNNNALQFFRANGRFPIVGPLGVGGGWWWYSRLTSYTGSFVEARKTQSEWRAFLTLSFGRTGLRKPKV